MSDEISAAEIIGLLGGTKKTADLCGSAWQSVSDWKRVKNIPAGKLFLLAYPLEVATEGKWSRKRLFPDVWRQVWPELDFEVKQKNRRNK